MKRGVSVIVILLVAMWVFSFIGKYTGAITAAGYPGGRFKYDIPSHGTILTIVSGELGEDGISVHKQGQALTVQVFPGGSGGYIHDGYKIIDAGSGRKMEGGFGHPGTGGTICNNRPIILDETQVCAVSGPKCSCNVEIRGISTVGFELGIYAFQVCDAGFEINKCNDGKGITEVFFEIVEPGKKISLESYFRGEGPDW